MSEPNVGASETDKGHMSTPHSGSGLELTLHAFTLISYLSSLDFVFNVGVSCHWLTDVDLLLVRYSQCCFMENFIQLITMDFTLFIFICWITGYFNLM